MARDSTSSYPADALSKPDIGYMRALSSEGILSQKPDLILSEDGSGPADVIAILKASAVPFVTVDTPPSGEAIAKKIEDVGAAVGLSDKAKALAAETKAGLDALAKDVVDATSYDEMAAAVRAIDRIMRHDLFVVPGWYNPNYWVAYYDMFEHPEPLPPYDLGYLDFWWFNADKAAALKSAGAIR